MEQWWWSPSLAHPLRSIALCFVAWKSLLLVIAACSPGRGYDTSTSLILPGPNDEGTLGILDGVLGRLTRWDAIYFVKIANRYYVFEQEWAFGWGLILWLGTSGLKRLGVNQYAGMEALVGVMVAHAAHFFAVLCLYSLTQAVFPGVHSNRFALSTALLHILSPAGLFLSAPYAESSCALMTFFGHLLFAKSLAPDGYPTAFQDFLTLCCGMSFGIATTLRSNGLLNGLVLLEEAFRTLLRLKQGFHMNVIRRLLLTGFGGICVGAGFVIPQYIAYMEYCGHTNGEATRPWCGKPIPSIYAFVQDHYWNVGLFRYWTLSNLPLFFLAAPISTIMIISGIWGLRYKSLPLPTQGGGIEKVCGEKLGTRFPIIRNMAISQLLLTLLTLTGAHVQIITRISSAYPVCLWYLVRSCGAANGAWTKEFVRFVVIYAVVQGGLFSSFLPPA